MGWWELFPTASHFSVRSLSAPFQMVLATFCRPWSLTITIEQLMHQNFYCMCVLLQEKFLFIFKCCATDFSRHSNHESDRAKIIRDTLERPLPIPGQHSLGLTGLFCVIKFDFSTCTTYKFISARFSWSETTWLNRQRYNLVQYLIIFYRWWILRQRDLI